MTKQEPTKAQWIELLEWCGLKRPPPSCKEPNHMLVPVGKGEYGENYCQVVDLDLNSLFKYPLPSKVWKVEFNYGELGCACYLEDTDGNKYESFVDADDYEDAKTKTALALFWAIWEVIHGR